MPVIPPQYGGIATEIAYTPNVTIVSSTNASPIVVTTAAVHGLVDGDIVEIRGHESNNAANGVWQVQIVSLVEIALYRLTGAASTGNGVGGATGYVMPSSTGTYATVADGQKRDATSVNVGLETLGDRTALALHRLRNAMVPVDFKPFQVADDAFNTWSTTNPVSNTVWTELASVDTFVSTAQDAHVCPDDWIEVDFSTTATVSNNGTEGVALALFAHLYDYGTAPLFVLATRIPGSAVVLPNNSKGPLHLRAFVPETILPSAISRGKRLRIYVGALSLSITTETVLLKGDRRIVSRVWRQS